MGPIMTMSQEPCGSCGQSGQKVLDECGECRGRKTVERESVLAVVVEPGMQDGDRITFEGQLAHAHVHVVEQPQSAQCTVCIFVFSERKVLQE